MRCQNISIRYRNAGIVVLVIIISFFLLLRFIHLQSDFPHQLTWSGDVYTDEGWNANNAIAYQVRGDWHVEGDWNPAVFLPVYTLLQVASFKLFGMSLFSARLTIGVFFLLSVLLILLILKKHHGWPIVLITAILLSVNYFLFAYSRIALMEIPMLFFAMVGMLLAFHSSGRYWYVYNFASSMFISISLLIKTSALFIFPVIFYIFYCISKYELHDTVKHFSFFILISFILFFIYYILAVSNYANDYHYFRKLNVSLQGEWNPLKFPKYILKAFWGGHIVDKILFAASNLFLIYAIMMRQELSEYRNAIVISAIWILSATLIFGSYNYAPPRYYVSNAIPVTVLNAILINYVLRKHFHRFVKCSILALYIAFITTNIYNIFNYMQSPKYSFLSMSKEIRRVISSEDNTSILMGHFANSISLANGVFSVNDDLGTEDLDQKIKRYHPKYYVSMGKYSESGRGNVLDRFYKVELISTFDVFDNYYNHKPVYFYRLRDKRL
jgi:4-amino-4-deoxy-L-arabinose transferase-like glycosyltransferase